MDTEIAFSAIGATTWAEFSGDYNPIHFDVAQAELFGMDSLVVHGMLALMPIKCIVSEAQRLSVLEVPSWCEFRALLCLPIPQIARVSVATRQSGSSTRFSATDKVSGVEYVRGSCKAISAVAERELYSNSHILVADSTLEDRRDRFYAAYASIAHPWVALDAIVFSDFIQSKLGLIYECAREAARKELGVLSREILSVHSSHSVLFCADAIAQLFQSADPLGLLQVTVIAPDFITSARQQICTVTLLVKHRQELLMSVTIGIVSREVPASLRPNLEDRIQ